MTHRVEPHGGRPLVSVVVPVFNPGADLDRCVESMLAQTMPAGALEVLFVDDGSTDETGARLDALARAHASIRVVHIPNSGWPGKPRNIGIAEARGEYVQFLDQDDSMAPDALEALYDIGRRNGSDIVIGKVAGNFRQRDPGAAHAIRGVPHVLFERTREACTIRDAPLIDSLTPHKMFRTAFLREHGICFPEGRRRLEDQLFVVPAYFDARTVSVLADRVCYFYTERDDGSNAGSARITPAGYFADLREVITIVRDRTEAGELRNRLLRRFLRVEILGRLSEPSHHAYDESFRAELFEAARSVVLDLIEPEVDAGLGAVARLRVGLIRGGHPDELLELSRRCADVRVTGTVERFEAVNGRFQLQVEARLIRDAGQPFTVRGVGETCDLDAWLTDGLSTTGIDLRDERGSVRVRMLVRDRLSGAQWSVKTTTTLDWQMVGDSAVTPVARLEGTLDAATLAGGRPLERGSWDLYVRMTGFGLDRTANLVSDLGAWQRALPQPILDGRLPGPAIPFRDSAGGVGVDVGRAARPLTASLRGSEIRVVHDGLRLGAILPLQAGRVAAELPVAVLLRAPERAQVLLPGRLVTRGRDVVLLADTGRRVRGVPRGPAEVLVLLDGADGPELPIGAARLGVGRRLTMVDQHRVGWINGTRWMLGEWGRAAYRRLPTPLQRWARSRVPGRAARQ